MTKELINREFHVNKKKVQRLIRKLGIEVRSFTRRSRRYNSYREKIGMITKNRIHRRFYTSICHQKITTDTTELKYFETEDCVYRRTFHSDQEWAYQMKAYSHKLKDHKIFQSMSRKGICLDNSIMENFFSLLRQEIYYGRDYHSFEELKQVIDGYIHYYNHEHMKRKLNWQSTVQFRKIALKAV